MHYSGNSQEKLLIFFFFEELQAIGEWRRLDNEELHILYHPPNILRSIKCRTLRWEGHVARMDGRSAFKNCTCTPTGKRPLGRPRRR